MKNNLYYVIIINSYYNSTELVSSFSESNKENYHMKIEEVNTPIIYTKLETYNNIKFNISIEDLKLLGEFILKLLQISFIKKNIISLFKGSIKYLLYIGIIIISIISTIYYFINKKKKYMPLQEFSINVLNYFFNENKSTDNKDAKNIYGTLDNINYEIKTNLNSLSLEKNNICVENINKLYFHFNNIKNIKSKISLVEMNQLELKKSYMDLLHNIYWSINAFIILIENKIITPPIVKNIINFITMIIPISIPTDIINFLIKPNILRVIQQSVSDLIDRQKIKFSLYKLNIINNIPELKLININNKYTYHITNIFDEEFFQKCILIGCENIKEYLNNNNLFMSKILNSFIDDQFLQKISQKIVLLQIKKIIEIEELIISESFFNLPDKIQDKIKKFNIQTLKMLWQFILTKNEINLKKNTHIMHTINKNIPDIYDYSQMNPILNKDCNLTNIFNSLKFKKIPLSIKTIINYLHKMYFIPKKFNTKNMHEIILLILKISKEDMDFFIKNKNKFLKIISFIPTNKVHILIKFFENPTLYNLKNIIIEYLFYKSIIQDDKYKYLDNILEKFINLKELELILIKNYSNINSLEDYLNNLLKDPKFIKYIIVLKNFMKYFIYNQNNNDLQESINRILNNKYINSYEKNFSDINKTYNAIDNIFTFLQKYSKLNINTLKPLIPIIIDININYIKNNTINSNDLIKLKDKGYDILNIIINPYNKNNIEDPLLFIILDYLQENNLYIYNNYNKHITNLYLEIKKNLNLNTVIINILRNLFFIKKKNINDIILAFKKQIFDIIYNILKNPMIRHELNIILLQIIKDKICNKININLDKDINTCFDFLCNEIQHINYNLNFNEIVINIIKNFHHNKILHILISNHEYIRKIPMISYILDQFIKIPKIILELYNYNIIDFPDVIKKVFKKDI